MGARAMWIVLVVLALVVGIHAGHGKGHRWAARWLPAIHGH